MKPEIVIVSNQFEKSEEWVCINSIPKTIFTDVLSESEIMSDLRNSASASSVFLVYAHLNTYNKKSSDDFGFDVARNIRMNLKSKAPIILFSPQSIESFEQLSKSKVKYKIIYGRGTGFLQLINGKFNKNALNQLIDELKQSPLTDAVLTDMNEMLLNQKGVIIDKLTHELQFVKVENNLDELKFVLSGVAAYMSSIQLRSLDWENFSTKLFSSISDVGKFNDLVDELLKKCDRELINEVVREETKSQRKHKIILLEDDQDFQKVIEENLKRHFEELLITESAEKAIELLQDDGGNEITGIISDWRLYADHKEKTYWQLQGYEVLDYAAKNRLIALFALTSLSDRNVHNIRNTLGLDIHLFKKQHLETTDSKVQWEMMADTVKQKCDTILEVISSQPTGEGWKNLKNEYIIRRGAGWNSFENEINQEATRIFSYYLNAMNTDAIRNVYSISELGVVLKNNLKSILIARRVYFGIYFTLVKTNNYLQEINGKLLGDGSNIDTGLKHHSIDTHSIIRKDWWDDISGGLDSTLIEDAWSKLEQRMKNLRGTLCVELTELPSKGILPEEKFWLSKNNIDFSFLFNYWQLDE